MNDSSPSEWLDIFIEKYREYLEPNNNTVILNKKRFEEMKNAYDAIVRSVKGKNISIKHEIFELDPTAGSIEISGKNIYIDDMGVFSIAIDASSVVEVYPLLDGKICIGLSFNDVGRMVGE